MHSSQPAAADDAYGTGRDVLSGEEGEATPSGTEAGKYPILLGVLVLIGSVVLYIYTSYSSKEGYGAGRTHEKIKILDL